MESNIRIAKRIVRLAKALVAGDFDCTVNAGEFDCTLNACDDFKTGGGDFDCTITAGRFDDDEVDERPDYSIEDIVNKTIENVANCKDSVELTRMQGSGNFKGKIYATGYFKDTKTKTRLTITACSGVKEDGRTPCIMMITHFLINENEIYGDKSTFTLHSDFADTLGTEKGSISWIINATEYPEGKAQEILHKVLEKVVAKLKSIAPDLADAIRAEIESKKDAGNNELTIKFD